MSQVITSYLPLDHSLPTEGDPCDAAAALHFGLGRGGRGGGRGRGGVFVFTLFPVWKTHVGTVDSLNESRHGRGDSEEWNRNDNCSHKRKEKADSVLSFFSL